MSAAVPRSCLKSAPRNPWVAEDGGESSTSSGQQQQQQDQPSNPGHTDGQRSHDLLAHQYATPYQQASSAHSLGHHHHHHSLTVSQVGHSAPQSVAGSQTVVSATRTTGAHHGVVHSHTAHSLHSSGRHLPPTAHSVHSVPGTLQQPWVEHHQMLWTSPAMPGLGSVPGGVYTVGGGPEGSCPALPPGVYGQSHAFHHAHIPQGGGGGSSGQTSSAGAVGWGLPTPHPPTQSGGVVNVWGGGGGGIGDRSQCERCHYYCFRLAQALYVAGIVTGFSLLVAGGVFHRQHVAHLQVLVYIGAMVSLVCVVLLVIFCAMNKDHRTRRGVSMRFAGPQVVIGDPEAVPLRAIDVNNPIVVQGGDGGSSADILYKGNQSQSACMGPLSGHKGNQNVCMPPPCMVPQNICYVGPTSHTPDSVLGSVNHGPPPTTNPDLTHHLPQTRHQQQPRAEDECEANHRYNRLWKQPNQATSEATSKL